MSNFSSSQAAIASENKHFLPSVNYRWTLVNPFFSRDEFQERNDKMPEGLQSVQFNYGPFSIGETKWRIEWSLPSGGLYLERVWGLSDHEVLSFRLSATSAEGQQLYGPKHFTLSFNSENQEAHIESLGEDHHGFREMPFLLEAFVRPEFYMGGLPCDFRVAVYDKSDTYKKLAEFDAHRYVLSKVSSVFDRMLQDGSPFEEARTGVIKIGNFSPETVRALLVFFYTGKIGVCKQGDPYFYGIESGGEEEVLELLDAAEQYQVIGDLKKQCGVRLFALINFGNAVDLLSVADRYHLEELKKKVLLFISENHQQIMQSGNYDDALERLPPKVMLGLIKTLSSSLTKKDIVINAQKLQGHIDRTDIRGDRGPLNETNSSNEQTITDKKAYVSRVINNFRSRFDIREDF